ncbi:hypothetical protein V5799_032704 [Amblyomma americanum]|uniref:Uncharacterized protein n=1 Tax=Amblyomma americanum TaxID=6943 RepID=A0AAQ4DQE7_AMBAM
MVGAGVVQKGIPLLLFLAIPCQCKIVQGVLKTPENWAFLTRFCFLSKLGHFIYELEYPVVSVLFSRSYLHTTYKMFMVSVLCQLLGLLCLVTYYAMYADDGIGIAQLKLLGRVLSSVSTLVFLLLLILVAKGYTVTRGRLKPSTSAKIGTFMTLYVVVYTALFIYERQYFDPGEVLYLYESPAGYGIVALRLVGWGWFVYATVFTLLHYPEKTAFYTRLFLLYTIWLLSAPVIILIAAFVVPKWMREKVINVVELMVILFAHIVFLVLTRPSKANKNFPFHVRTTQVDVVQHPTIGVISDNYIDRFPHHAYAPTESIVVEPTAPAVAMAAVDYATLFGGGGRPEHENNNWQQLKSYPNQLSVTHMLDHLNGHAGGSMREMSYSHCYFSCCSLPLERLRDSSLIHFSFFYYLPFLDGRSSLLSAQPPAPNSKVKAFNTRSSASPSTRLRRNANVVT